MANLSGSAAALRADGYRNRVYLAQFPEIEIYRATVDSTPATYPVTSLAVTTVSGSTGAILEDMEIRVTSSGGAFKGRLRVAPGGYSGGTLQVNEYGAARIAVVATDIVIVYRSWRLRDRVVAANENFDRDSRVTYSDQNADQQPLAASGGAFVGFVDATTGLLTVSFDGSASAAVDPDSGGTLTHAWAFDASATPTTSTAASPSGVTFPAGKYWVSHTVTDSDNGKSDVQYVPVLALERTGSNAPLDVSRVSLNGARETGWDAEIELVEAVSYTTLPDGAGVIVFVEEWYQGSKQSFGANITGRSNIKFLGYLVSDTNTADAESNDRRATLRAVSPLGLLQQLPGFSQVMERVNSPANWLEQKGLTVTRALIFLLRWETTWLRCHDLVITMTTFNYPLLFIQEQTPFEQIKELTEGCDALASCDRLGRLLIYNHPLLRDSSERSAMTTMFTLTDDDVIDVDIERNQRKEVSLLETRGFLAGTDLSASQPMFSRSTDVPDEAPGKQVIDRKIAVDQSSLNARNGWQFALLNSTYNGLPVGRIRLRLPPAYGVFDFFKEWLALTLAANTFVRSDGYSGTRLWIERMTETYTDGAREVDIEVQQETDGAAGVTYVPPSGPPVPPLPPVPPGTVTGAETNTIAVFCTNNAVYITNTFGAAEPVWTEYALALTGTLQCFVPDPFSPKYLTGSGAVNGWIVTSERRYRIADVFGARTLSDDGAWVTAFDTANFAMNLQTERGVQNWVVMVGSNQTTTRMELYYTLDGSTWLGPVDLGAWSAFAAAGLFVSGRAAGKLYALANSGASAFVSTDFGATVGALTSPQLWATTAPKVGLHVPYGDLTEQTAYFSEVHGTFPNFDGHIYRADGTTVTDITPESTYHIVNQSGNFMVDSPALDSQRVVVCARQGVSSGAVTKVFVSRNRGAVWSTVALSESTIGGAYYAVVRCSGANPNVFYLLGRGRIAYSNDFGTTLADKLGNIPTDYPATSSKFFVNLCGG